MGLQFPGPSSSPWECNFGKEGYWASIWGGLFFSTRAILSRNAENSVLLDTFYNVIFFFVLFGGHLKLRMRERNLPLSSSPPGTCMSFACLALFFFPFDFFCF